jgi:hypothetical protein
MDNDSSHKRQVGTLTVKNLLQGALSSSDSNHKKDSSFVFSDQQLQNDLNKPLLEEFPATVMRDYNEQPIIKKYSALSNRSAGRLLGNSQSNSNSTSEENKTNS